VGVVVAQALTRVRMAIAPMIRIGEPESANRFVPSDHPAVSPFPTALRAVTQVTRPSESTSQFGRVTVTERYKRARSGGCGRAGLTRYRGLPVFGGGTGRGVSGRYQLDAGRPPAEPASGSGVLRSVRAVCGRTAADPDRGCAVARSNAIEVQRQRRMALPRA